MHTLIHIHAHSYTCITHSYTLIHIHTLRYTRTLIHTYTCTHARTHTHVQTHTCANIITFKMKMVKNYPCRMTESINEHTPAQHTCTAHAHSTHIQYTCRAHMNSAHTEHTHTALGADMLPTLSTP